MIEVPEKVSQIIVVKRDGKKVPFDGTKIALAIQKGFGDIIGVEKKYQEKDINKVYSKVLLRIEKMATERIKIEQIQDLIEEELKKNGYQDVYEAFSSYREKRAQSRKLFFDEKKQHKFLKALENLGLKSEKQEIERQSKYNTAMGTMLQYGKTISCEFAKSYLIKKKFAEAHENGDIFIHDIDFIPMGTTTNCQIDLSKLYHDGFSTGYGFIREPKDIMTCATLATIAIQTNQNDQHGSQNIAAFDYDMAPGVLKTFKKQLKQTVYDYLELTDFNKFIAMNGIEREIEKINSIDFDISIFYRFCRESEELKRLFSLSYQKAYEKTNYLTYQAMEGLIHDLNNLHSRGGAQVPFSCINLGTNISSEGRMVIKNFLLALEAGLGDHKTAPFPIVIFKVKSGINFEKEDKNYDLFELACKVAAKRGFPNFSFLDAPFNKKYYQKENYETEVAYMGCTARVVENVVDKEKQISVGRGNLATTTINLPRLGIKYANISNSQIKLKSFFQELEEKMDLVKDQLLERFEIECSKKVYHFPFLLGQGIWIDSEKLKETDNIKKVLKQGTLSIGFTGLAECLKILTGSHHGEDEKSQALGLKIVKLMQKKCEEYCQKYNLNFTLSGTYTTGVSKNLMKLDRAIFGKLKGITDKESYTNAFDIPKNYKITLENKLKIEAPYHELTNGGHLFYVANDKNLNEKKIEEHIRQMKEAGIGYAVFDNQ